MFSKYVPHILFFSRLSLSGYGVYAFFQHRYFLMLLLFGISFVAEYLDGPLGRRWDAESPLGKYLNIGGDVVSSLSRMITIYSINPAWVLSSVPSGVSYLMKRVYGKEVTVEKVDATWLDEIYKYLNKYFFPTSLYLTLIFPGFETLVKPMFSLTVILGSVSTWQVWRKL